MRGGDEAAIAQVVQALNQLQTGLCIRGSIVDAGQPVGVQVGGEKVTEAEGTAGAEEIKGGH